MTSLLDIQQPLDPMSEAFMWAKDSTLATSAMGVGGGYAMGVAFSLFGAMISAETATSAMGTAHYFKYALKNAHSLGANFAFFGFIFGGIEVALEKRRGRKDYWNQTASGALIGAIYGYRSFKFPGLIGGFAGGAVFSLLIERVMDSAGIGQK